MILKVGLASLFGGGIFGICPSPRFCVVWACVPGVGWYAAIIALRLIVYRVYDVAVLGLPKFWVPCIVPLFG